MSTTRDWDATTYDRVSAPQQRWAAEQLDRLELAGDEVVVDAGCGSGKITLELIRRVPRGTVYAVDAAPSMVRHTQEAVGDRATALCQDLVALDLPLRVLLRDDADGRTLVSFHPIAPILRRAGVPETLATKLDPAQFLLVEAIQP